MGQSYIHKNINNTVNLLYTYEFILAFLFLFLLCHCRDVVLYNTINQFEMQQGVSSSNKTKAINNHNCQFRTRQVF